MILRDTRNSQYLDGICPIFYRHNFYLTYQKKLGTLEMLDHMGQDHSSVDHTDYIPVMKNVIKTYITRYFRFISYRAGP